MVTIFTKETATKGLLGSLKRIKKKRRSSNKLCVCVIERYCPGNNYWVIMSSYSLNIHTLNTHYFEHQCAFNGKMVYKCII